MQRTLSHFILSHIVPPPSYRKEGEAVSYLSQVVYRNTCYRSDERSGQFTFNLFGFRSVGNQALTGNRVVTVSIGLDIQFVLVVLHFKFVETNKKRTPRVSVVLCGMPLLGPCRFVLPVGSIRETNIFRELKKNSEPINNISHLIIKHY